MDSLLPADAAWFAEHPHREFRCRPLTDAECLPADVSQPGMTAVRLIYIRKSDGASAKVWTPRPDLLLAEEDEGTARFAAQGMPNPPPLNEPVRHVEAIPVSAAVAERLRAQAVQISLGGHR